MNRRDLRGQRLAAAFAVGVLLLNYPLLAIFSSDSFVLGVPVLYAYVFSAWVVLIALLTVVARR